MSVFGGGVDAFLPVAAAEVATVALLRERATEIALRLNLSDRRES
jgi:hypothetical protein